MVDVLFVVGWVVFIVVGVVIGVIIVVVVVVGLLLGNILVVFCLFEDLEYVIVGCEVIIVV
ncbi:gntP permease, partial [Bacillus thuringiensis]|nr:gntP permease [Bacillus thuringiensis]